MTHRIEDQNRRALNFASAKVKDVLPEYFVSDYSKLVTFLEKYHDFLDSDGDNEFKKEINDIFAIRDIEQTSTENLDLVISEIGDGLRSASFFSEPRLMARLLANFYRAKGTRNSTEGFFRGFFDEEVTIEYPKVNIFTINDADNNFLSHQIGADSQKFIQDNFRFQIFSILVKSGISVSAYENLYKKLVHPSGFHFAGEVALELQGQINVTALQGSDSDEIRGISSIDPIISGTATVAPIAPFTQLTSLLDSNGLAVRIVPDQYLQDFSTVTVGTLDSYYDHTIDIVNPNSFTFDDSDNTHRPTASITLETMDNEIFTRYTSDSAV